MTPRPSKPTAAATTPPPREGTPREFEAATQDHNFGTQFAFDVNKQIGKLETGLAGVDKRLEKVESKLDQVQIDIASLKTTATHIESLMKTSVKALWTIAGSLGVFGLGLVTLWLKHKLNW